MRNLFILILTITITITITLVSNLDAKLLPETELIKLELEGEISDRNSELSGMDWYKDNLVLLPQYPNFPNYQGTGRLFYLPKQELLERIVGDVALPLRPSEISIEVDFFYQIPGFEGFEAIAFQGDDVYLTIESEPDKIKGFLVKGKINEAMTEIVLDTLFLQEIPPQADIPNASEESILIRNEQIMTFYEGNGSKVNPSPVAHVYKAEIDSLSKIEFTNLEYRVTDATAIDEKDKFWVINYFWPGEKEVYDPAPDPLVELYGTGVTHTDTEVVERIVQLRYFHGKIIRTDKAPILLKLGSDARNLEGIVKLDDLGFLLCTDKFPETILGFIPIPQTE